MRRAISSLIQALGLFVFVAFFTTVASAQFGSGIQGVVTDGTGSVVPGASVVLTNTATNVTIEAVTNDNGQYRFVSLTQGVYKIVVTKSGFKKKLVNNAVLDAETQARVDVALDPGDITAEVTVDGSDGPQLETESPNLTRNLTTREIIDLPQVGRDPYGLVRLAPGVFGDGARAAGGAAARLGNSSQSGPGGSNNGIFAVENQVQVTANGQRVTSNNFEIDGVSVNSQTWGGAAVVTPSQESVAEVQVTSSTYSAEDGRNSGAQVKVITKYGGNDYSGSAFLKLNNPGLNAYNEFRGIPGVTGLTGLNPTRVNDRFTTFGGSFGGKIIRDKLFYFFTYEGNKNVSNAISAPALVETASFRQQMAALRAGSLSAAYFGNAGAEPRVAQILTPLCSLLGAPYNTGGTNCQVVGNGLDIGSITGAYGTYLGDNLTLPGNNAIGGGLDGIADLQYVTLNTRNTFRGNQYGLRMDYQLSAKDKIAFTSYFTPLSAFSTNTAAQSRPQADLNSDRLTYLVGGNYSRIISSTLINDFRFNMTKWSFNEIAANPETNWGLPRIEIEAIWGGERLRFGAPRAETTPGFFNQRQMDFRNVLTKIWGNQSIKFGAQYRKELNQSGAPGGARPLYSFTRMWNFANGAPIFESINADANGNPKANDVPFNTANISFFVQDNWKFRPNVTLNMGLRWEYFAPIKVSDGNQIGRLKLGALGLNDAVIERVTRFTNPDYNNFAPQLGFAWSPGMFGGKVVLRGGGGMGYDRLASALFSNVRFTPPNAARYSICCGNATNNGVISPTAGTIQFVRSTDGTIYGYPRNPTLGGGFGPNGGPVNGQIEIYSAPADMPSAYVYRYSMEAQYEAPWKFVATLAYQGSKGSRFVRILPLHQLFTQVSTAPTFRTVFYASPDVNTSYNAMVAGLRRRFSDSFNVNVNYRFSKSLDTVSVESPCACTNQTYSYDNGEEKGPSDFDVTHYFNASGTWEPSWFKGRQDIFGDLLHGWAFSPIVTWRGGFPWTPVTGGAINLSSTSSNLNTIRPRAWYGTAPLNNSNETYLAGGQFPNNLIAGAACNNLATTPAGCSRYFLTPLNGTSYLTNVPGIGRNVFRGPRYFNVDLSIAKRVDLGGLNGFLGEAARLDVRFNFFNLLNNLNFASFNAFSNSTRVDNAQFGVPTAALAGRVGEFQVRFSF